MVESLGKCFVLAESRSSRQAAGWKQKLHAATAWMQGTRVATAKRKEFWALKDVSFSVARGTVLGIVGANGAGKSTLLKIIARITPPTTGRILGQGRVVSLLELGAGFNPEVSARENIFMNAAMYGVPSAQVERHFDDIIGFAEIPDFVDTPLKSYSSGMYLRLAFSVAVNMRPEILLADEILAVGDLAFQQRCLERVDELAEEGLTVLFVSHDMDAIMRVCDRVLWINQGQVVQDGDPEEVVTEYQKAAWARAEAARSEQGRHVNRFAELIGARLVTETGKEIGAAPLSEDLFVRIRLVAKADGMHARFGFDLCHKGGLIFRSMSEASEDIVEPGLYEAWGRIPAHFLSELLYSLHAFVILERDGKESSLIIYNAMSFLAYSTDEAEKQRLLKGALLAPRLDWKFARPGDSTS